MTAPRLSICIPTHNFGKFIGATLKSIADQHNELLEVVVVDGASTDCTPEVVRSFEKQLPGMRYIRLDTKGGIDRDMAYAVEAATGEYCWLMSSDDVIRPGAIVKVMAALNAGGDIFLCNRIECDIALKPKRDKRWLRRSIVSHTYRFQSSNDFVAYFRDARSLGALFSYMSSIVFRRSMWQQVVYDGSLDDTNYAHVYRLFSMLKHGGQLVYLSDPLVLCRGNNDSFAVSGLAKRLAIDLDGYKRIADKIAFDESEKKSFLGVIRHEHPWYSWYWIARERNDAVGVGQWKAFKERLGQFGYGKMGIFAADLLGRLETPINGLRLAKRALVKGFRLVRRMVRVSTNHSA